ncbi:hypothetical protein ACUOCP_39695, partial [Escherichia sp. R-CC3]
KKSVKTPLIKRPLMPPIELPLIYNPIGHARRRQDGIPKLVDKFKINLARQFPTRQQQRILEVSLDRTRLEQMPVNEYLDLYVI